MIAIKGDSVSEFIAFAKRNPGTLTMASASTARRPILAGELFKMMAAVDMVHVPYRGGRAAVADLLGGQVDATFSNLPVGEHVRSGKLRAWP